VVDANAIDANAIGQAVQQSSSGFDVSGILSQALQFLMGQINTAFQLVQQNLIWLAIIGILTWALADFGLSRVGMHRGILRYVVSFFIVMALSFLWIGLLQGIVNGF
jgi:hypothetical protein